MSLENTIGRKIDNISYLLRTILESNFPKLGENYNESYVLNAVDNIYHKVKILYNCVVDVPRVDIFCLTEKLQ
jgi:tRNA A37 threonylcarbamoyladenosine dehydratase